MPACVLRARALELRLPLVADQVMYDQIELKSYPERRVQNVIGFYDRVRVAAALRHAHTGHDTRRVAGIHYRVE